MAVKKITFNPCIKIGHYVVLMGLARDFGPLFPTLYIYLYIIKIIYILTLNNDKQK